ncbi:MAG: APC family permease [Candidatus Babeliales bacterium]
MQAIKIPVWLAIIININIVVGVGFFLGAQNISMQAGLLAPAAWLICGLMLLPLMVAFARLSERYPTAGGLYVYSYKQLGSFFGFVSGWGYFIGTAAANACVMHAFSQRVYELGMVNQSLQSVGLGLFGFDVLLIGIFICLNLVDIKILERLQIFFTILKVIPLILTLVGLAFLFDWDMLCHIPVCWGGLLGCLPAVLFGFIGLEACCAITDKIAGDKKNAAFVILASLTLVMFIYSILQFALLSIHGTSACDPFMSILPKLTSNQTVISWGNTCVYGAILSSLLAGFYGAFYFNNWNLYAIGQENSIVGSRHLIKLNKNHAPWVCVLVQAALALLFIFVTNKIDALYSMSDVGTLVAYLLSAVAFLALSRSITAFLAIAGCTVLIGICTSHLLDYGLPLLPFWIVFVLGIALHYANAWWTKQHHSS